MTWVTGTKVARATFSSADRKVGALHLLPIEKRITIDNAVGDLYIVSVDPVL